MLEILQEGLGSDMHTIKILSNEEFDNLPTSETNGSDISQSLGFANPFTGRAYVRYSAYPEVTKFLVEHELEELFGPGHPGHEDENGIRHFAWAAILPFLAKAVSAILGGAKALGSAAVTGAKVGGSSLIKGGGNLLSGAGNLISKIPGGVGDLLSKGTGSIMNLFSGGGGGSQLPSNAGITNTSPFIPATPGQLSPGQLMQQTVGQSTSQASNNPLSMFKQFLNPGGDNSTSEGLSNAKTLLGAGSLAAGLLKPLPKAPDISGITGELRNQFSANQNSQANQVLNQNLSKQFNPLTQPEIDSALRQYKISREQQRKQILDLYRNVRPGSDPTTDSSMERDLNLFDEQTAIGESDIVASKSRGAEQSFNQNQMQNIQAQLGANSNEMEQLQQIAQLNIDQIMSQLGLDYTQASLFKETFVGLGQDILGSSLNLFQPTATY